MSDAFSMTKSIDWKSLERMMAEQEILIGWPEGMPHAESGEDISEIARKLSFGAGPQTWTKTLGGVTKTFHVEHVEARPILDDGIEAGREEISDRIRKYYEKASENGQSKSLLHAIAVTAVGAVQKFARLGSYKSTAPNLPAWSEMKKGAPPWIDTGQVINTLTYVIADEVYHEGKDEDGESKWTAN